MRRAVAIQQRHSRCNLSSETPFHRLERGSLFTPLAKAALIIACLIPTLLLCKTEASAQSVALRGFITDASSGQTLWGANVVVGDSLQGYLGAISNEDGYYQINQIAPGRYPLRISYIGFAAYFDTLSLGNEPFVTLSVALAPAEELLDEVVVSSEREGGTAKLTGGHQRVRPSDMGRIPTPDATGDLASYLQTQPGVVSQGDRGGQLFIRGGTPSQNLVLLDGMLVYQPFHIVGFFSAFPQDLVTSADVYAGGFGARYSGRISSVIDVNMRSGNNQRFAGAASLSPFLAGVRLEGPLRKGALSVLGSLRSSVIEQTAPALLGASLPLNFMDAVVKVQHTGKDNSRCSVTAMHTYDRGRIDPERSTRDAFQWSNNVLGGRCVAFAPSSSVLIEINGGISQVSNSVGAPENPERSASAWRFNSDLHLTAPLGPSEISWGFYGRADQMRYRLEERLQGSRSDKDFLISAGGYVSAKVPLGARADMTPGLVVSLPLDYHPGLEPRFRFAWRPWGTAAQELNAAIGLYRQEFEGIHDERDAGSVFTAWIPAPAGGIRSRAMHALLGWKQQVGNFGFAAEGYYKRLTDLPAPRWSSIARFTTSLIPANGKEYGIDSRLEWQRQGLYAYLGYGFSWTRYSATQDNFGVWFGTPVQQYHPPHDRRHQVNALLSARLGAFQMSAGWQFGSGLPYTQLLGFDGLLNLTGLRDVRDWYGLPRILYEKPYLGRLPAYHRLDVALARTFSLRVADLTLQTGAINVYNRANLFYFDLFTFRRVDQLPIVPYASIRLETH